MLYSVKNLKHNVDSIMTSDELIKYASNYCTTFVFEVFGEVEEFNLSLDESISCLTEQHFNEDQFTITEL